MYLLTIGFLASLLPGAVDELAVAVGVLTFVPLVRVTHNSAHARPRSLTTDVDKMAGAVGVFALSS